jgi:hypothetical protein
VILLLLLCFGISIYSSFWVFCAIIIWEIKRVFTDFGEVIKACQLVITDFERLDGWLLWLFVSVAFNLVKLSWIFWFNDEVFITFICFEFFFYLQYL